VAKTQALIKFTYADYKSLPYSERERYELLEGELVPMPASPGEPHQWVSMGLASFLYRFVREHQLGRVYQAPLDVVLGEMGDERVVQPDILFISQARSDIIQGEEIRGAPDLVVEVLSPTTEEKDRTYKRTLYARYGVKEYWLVDPGAQTVEVLTLGERGYHRAGFYQRAERVKSPLLAGLEIPLSEVF
jgi:Uma2 family endonuclease